MTTPPTIEDRIRELLGDGSVPNRAVAQQLGVGPRRVADVRQAAGLPAAPRSAWRNAPHPKDAEIRTLLGEGITDRAIREATGADVTTIARIRKAGGYGRATITRCGTRPHPKDAEIRQQISSGASNAAVRRATGADVSAIRRIRRDMGVACPPQHTHTLESKWAERARPIEGGHLEWAGERGNVSGTPLIRYREQTYTAAAVAFRMRTGRDPVGPVKAECGVHQCVAPGHVEDAPGRDRLREQLRFLLGKGERPARCRRDHDQAEHGRLLPDGVAYCRACSDLSKHSTRRGTA
ncbi:hypothetical protein [Streptomyces sp. bgisy034]|uniref:hypothetical protein n=1 Tax=Streptomyces sp. bgisy034 TaxID=3413774 RepID=UPI003EB975F6